MSERVTIKQVWDKPPRDYSFEIPGTGTVHLREHVFTATDGRFIAFSQKPESDPPTDGLVLEFDSLKPPPEGKKLWKGKGAKRVHHEFDYSRPQTGQQPLSAVRSSSADWDPFHPRQRLIIRQNALNRALDYAIALKKFEVLDDDPRPGLSIETVVETRVDYFERLTWQSLAKGHELKVLEWAEAPAGGEPTSEVPTDPSEDASPPAGAGPPAEGIHTVTAPQSVPASEGQGGPSPGASTEGGGSASPSTLVQIQRLRRERNVPPLVFSTFLTSMGVEDISKLSEDDAQVVIAWIANGDGQVAA